MYRRRLVGLAVVATAILAGTVLLGWYDASIQNSADVNLFAAVGSTMLSGHWAYAFDSPVVQAGPLELAVAALARDVGVGDIGFAIAIDLFCTAAMLLAALAFLPRRVLALTLFGALILALRVPGGPYAGHPAEPLIAVLWLFAARAARRDRLLAAGALVGLAGCLELWGALGVAVLLLAPSPVSRRMLGAVASAGAIPVLALAPFALAGHFHMFSMHWPITHGVPRLLVGEGRLFTWPMRVVEAVVIVTLAGVTARLVRRLPESVWIVPATVALLRIALDPVEFGYYWDTSLLIITIGTTGLLVQPRALHGRLVAHFTSQSTTERTARRAGRPPFVRRA